jgi:hypothetical protein
MGCVSASSHLLKPHYCNGQQTGQGKTEAQRGPEMTDLAPRLRDALR